MVTNTSIREKQTTEDPAGDDPELIKDELRRAQRETTPTPPDPRLLGLGGGKIRGSRRL